MDKKEVKVNKLIETTELKLNDSIEMKAFIAFSILLYNQLKKDQQDFEALTRLLDLGIQLSKNMTNLTQDEIMFVHESLSHVELILINKKENDNLVARFKKTMILAKIIE